MVKKILICSMYFTLLFDICVFAQKEIPQGTPLEGTKFSESVEQPQDIPENIEGIPGGEQGENQQGQNPEQMTPPNMNFNDGNMPGGFNRNNMQPDTEPMTFKVFVREYQTPIISVILLLLAFLFVKLYKRKNY